MKRSPMPPRKSPMARSRITPKKRSAAETQRIYGGEDRRAWIASLPCSVPACPRTPSENAHTRTGGVGRKADADTVIPLCAVHHRQMHAVGQHTFARLHGLDLTRAAERIANAWRARHPMTSVGEILPAAVPDLPIEVDEAS